MDGRGYMSWRALVHPPRPKAKLRLSILVNIKEPLSELYVNMHSIVPDARMVDLLVSELTA